MQTPLVTVAIPMYNGARWIAETLRSASQQSYKRLDIIVVDDGSTDDSVRIVEGFCGRDERIRLSCQKNAGVCAARNRGLEAAKGELFAPLDQDDLWHPEKIRFQVDAFLSSCPQAGMAYTWCSAIDAQGRIICRNAGASQVEGSVLWDFIMSNPIPSGSVPMFRTNAIRQVGGYRQDYNPADDIDLYIRAAEQFDVLVIRKFLVGYRVHESNVSNNQNLMVDSYEKLIGDLQKRRPDIPARLFRWTVANSRFHYGLMALRARRKAVAASLLATALARDPVLLNRALKIFVSKLKRSFGLISDPLRGQPFLSVDPAEGPILLPESRRWKRRKLCGPKVNAGSEYSDSKLLKTRTKQLYIVVSSSIDET